MIYWKLFSLLPNYFSLHFHLVANSFSEALWHSLILTAEYLKRHFFDRLIDYLLLEDFHFSHRNWFDFSVRTAALILWWNMAKKRRICVFHTCIFCILAVHCRINCTFTKCLRCGKEIGHIIAKKATKQWLCMTKMAGNWISLNIADRLSWHATI